MIQYFCKVNKFFKNIFLVLCHNPIKGGMKLAEVEPKLILYRICAFILQYSSYCHSIEWGLSVLLFFVIPLLVLLNKLLEDVTRDFFFVN